MTPSVKIKFPCTLRIIPPNLSTIPFGRRPHRPKNQGLVEGFSFVIIAGKEVIVMSSNQNNQNQNQQRNNSQNQNNQNNQNSRSQNSQNKQNSQSQNQKSKNQKSSYEQEQNELY